MEAKMSDFGLRCSRTRFSLDLDTDANKRFINGMLKTARGVLVINRKICLVAVC